MSNRQNKFFSDNRKRVQQCTPFDELFKKMILCCRISKSSKGIRNNVIMNNATTLHNITPDNNICVSSTAHSLNTLQAALDYAESGFPVFPCNPENKSPLTANGFKSASTEYAEIEDWWLKYPNALIGMPTGKASGLFVLDIDVKHDVNGFDSLAALEKQYSALPTTLTVKTPSGGEHRYFIMPETSQTLSISAGKLGAGLDTRGDGGYVIIPPSLNSDSKAYEFVDIDVEPAERPDWRISLLLKPKSFVKQPPPLSSSVSVSSPYGHAALKGIVAEMADTPKGQRNDTLNRLAFRVGVLVKKVKSTNPIFVLFSPPPEV